MQQRLRAAHRRLTSPGETMPVGEVARDYGFSSAPQFRAAFRRHFGYAPSLARSGAGGGELRAATVPDDGNPVAAWLESMIS